MAKGTQGLPWGADLNEVQGLRLKAQERPGPEVQAEPFHRPGETRWEGVPASLITYWFKEGRFTQVEFAFQGEAEGRRILGLLSRQLGAPRSRSEDVVGVAEQRFEGAVAGGRLEATYAWMAREGNGVVALIWTPAPKARAVKAQDRSPDRVEGIRFGTWIGALKPLWPQGPGRTTYSGRPRHLRAPMAPGRHEVYGVPVDTLVLCVDEERVSGCEAEFQTPATFKALKFQLEARLGKPVPRRKSGDAPAGDPGTGLLRYRWILNDRCLDAELQEPLDGDPGRLVLAWRSPAPDGSGED